MAITNEQQFFLSLISDHLHCRKTDVPGGLDWITICSYAKTHQVQGIVFKQCKDGLAPSSQVYTELNSAFYQTVAANGKRLSLFKTVVNAFREQQITFIPVKGHALTQYYPIPQLRTMGDIDIVLSTYDREKAHEVLLQLGFQNTVHEDAEWEYRKAGVEIELHNQLEYELLAEHRDFFNDHMSHVQTTGDELALTPDFHLMYLILHLRKHLMNFGVGFRQFMDIIVLTQANLDIINWMDFAQKLKELKLLDFARTCFCFCERWFGFSSPLEPIEISDAFCETATETVFENGVFGFNNSDNIDVKINHLAKYKADHADNQKSLSWSRIREIVFPSYQTMCVADHYSFLRGRKWLLPIAWIYRLYRGITLRKMKSVGVAVQEAKTLRDSDDEISKRTAWLKEWKV